ncbi:hypothetical protein DSC45_16555 [Streptomyces sp. YIM 130001]|uniref:hypothetical protein n=1 Tax=Streptomyces sp. YIM 130001 TaxID=2259644 RepID=UPI000E64FFB7|nr:hypothetical protein [Streptomyces sp. YIM 130001]RII15853.1 hypothetical protein DSC45_16555 [Streptomyces sp. YIM 130001]
MFRRPARLALAASAAALLSTTVLTSSAQAKDGDPWKCSHGSSASATDAGGRDSYVTHVDPDNGDRVGMNFTANGEKLTQWNDSDDTADYYAKFYKGNSIDLTWHWNLEPKMADYTYNFERPEGQRVQLETKLFQPSKGGCIDNGGVA